VYAVAFDLVVADTQRYHPKSVAQAYSDIGTVLGARGFSRVQGSLYVTENEDMANLFLAMQDLRSLIWIPLSVRDIRAFRIEQWSDFTPVIKGL
jgi:virulence-associated protein VapD